MTPNTKVDILQYLTTSESRLTSTLQRAIMTRQESLGRLQRSVVFRQPERLYDSYLQKVDRLTQELSHRLRQHIQKHQQAQTVLTTKLSSLRLNQKVTLLQDNLDHDIAALQAKMTSYLEQQKQRADSAYEQLTLIDPVKIINRGFSIVRTHEGQVVKSVKDVTGGQKLAIEVSDGIVKVEVDK